MSLRIPFASAFFNLSPIMTSSYRRPSLEQGLLESETNSDSNDGFGNLEKHFHWARSKEWSAKYRHELQQLWHRLPSVKRSRIVILISILLLSLLGGLMWHHDVNPIDTLRPMIASRPQTNVVRYEKPEGLRIVGLVFYGRRDRVSVLDCYLKRNLVSAGGWLDEVVWAVNTDTKQDLQYLDELVATSTGYRKLKINDTGFHGIWKEALKRGTMFIKIDDDVVYMDDEAIPMIVTTKLKRPEALIVSAYMINSPEFNWLHYRSGAIHPYLPEITGTADYALSTFEHPIWRASELPQWNGPDDWVAPEVGNGKFIKEIWGDGKSPPPEPWKEWYKDEEQEISPEEGQEQESSSDEDFPKQYYEASPEESASSEHGSDQSPPSSEGKNKRKEKHVNELMFIPKHRWLPLPNRTDLSRTPISYAEYNAFGAGWRSWAIATQEHYSFLQNLETNSKHLYYLNHGSGSDPDATWDTTGGRISINLLAVMGEDMLDHIDEMGDDEEWLSQILPLQLHKRVLVHTRALAAHYAFFPQQDGVERTDLLDRYRAYAMQNVCPGTYLRPLN